MARPIPRAEPVTSARLGLTWTGAEGQARAAGASCGRSARRRTPGSPRATCRRSRCTCLLGGLGARRTPPQIGGSTTRTGWPQRSSGSFSSVEAAVRAVVADALLVPGPVVLLRGHAEFVGLPAPASRCPRSRRRAWSGRPSRTGRSCTTSGRRSPRSSMDAISGRARTGARASPRRPGIDVALRSWSVRVDAHVEGHVALLDVRLQDRPIAVLEARPRRSAGPRMPGPRPSRPRSGRAACASPRTEPSISTSAIGHADLVGADAGCPVGPPARRGRPSGRPGRAGSRRGRPSAR